MTFADAVKVRVKKADVDPAALEEVGPASGAQASALKKMLGASAGGALGSIGATGLGGLILALLDRSKNPLVRQALPGLGMGAMMLGPGIGAALGGAAGHRFMAGEGADPSESLAAGLGAGLGQYALPALAATRRGNFPAGPLKDRHPNSTAIELGWLGGGAGAGAAAGSGLSSLLSARHQDD